MRALVAGGAGFIGSHLCDRLIAEGIAVTCVDNFISGLPANIAHLMDRPDFDLIEHDVSQPFDSPADLIFHFASPASPNPASPKSYLAHPVATALANSQGSYQLLEIARRHGARYLFASTSEIYGEPLEHPQRETYFGNVNPHGIRSCYDESKRFGEAIAMTYHREFQVDVRLIRIFNTYGPRCDPADGRVIPNFVSQALTGDPITVYGDGAQTRSLCYVSDLVEGIWRMITSERTGGDVVNLGNPEEHTILEYARLIRDLCDSGSEVVFRELRTADDPSRRQPDITKARELLGWEPQVLLREGLKQTIAWYREHLPDLSAGTDPVR
ncbi:MAG: UDP-glucuronate decarboxylase [Chloroflexota bacterium]|nr:UDP-glucuronate decarboxylase [Chloroflexota bacterium]